MSHEQCSKFFLVLVAIILAYVLAYGLLTFSKVSLTKRVFAYILLTASLP